MATRQGILGEIIALEIQVVDATDNEVDPDQTPEVKITDPQNIVRRDFSSTDVAKISTGKYRLNYTAPLTGRVGTWTDTWRVVLNGVTTTQELNFTQLSQGAEINAAGAEVGDDPNIQYTQDEITGINILLAQLKARLKNDLESETIDEYGNIEYTTCSIFTNTELLWFLEGSLSEFNATPHFTDFHFSDEVIYQRYAYVIVEGAFILATAAQMLIEAGKEFNITDNGINFSPPQLSSVLNNELSHFVSNHLNTLKYIKGCIKPRPMGFGSFRVIANNPNFMRLRHLRSRRIV